MTLIEVCCNTPPTNAEWVNKGVDKVLPTTVNGEDRLTYRTGPEDSKRGIIGVYDIFGFHPTAYQFFDVYILEALSYHYYSIFSETKGKIANLFLQRLALANGGFQVSVPHMFTVDSPAAQLLGNRPALVEWVSKHGDYKNSHLDAVIRAAVEDLRADGCTSFSIIGQCWGAWIAVQAASEEDSVFLAAGGPHPSMTTIETVKDVRCPLIILASKDEDDMVCVQGK